MARRRMIDPNFWQSEDVSKLTIRQRLLLIGLFSNADDEGKMRGNPAFVRSAVFPYEDFTLCDIEQDLNKIESIGSIQQYEVEESKYIRLINWKKFQRVDKPQSSVIPEPLQNGSKSDSKNDSCVKERKGKELKGEEDKGREEKEMPSPDSNPHKDRILKLINECEIKEFNLYDLDVIYSYIGVVDVEVIEAAIKKGQKKESIKYSIRTLQGMVKDGITKKEQVIPRPEVGEYDAKKHEGQLQSGSTSSENKSITGGAIGWLPSKAKSDAANVVQLHQVSG